MSLLVLVELFTIQTEFRVAEVGLSTLLMSAVCADAAEIDKHKDRMLRTKVVFAESFI